MTREEEGRGLLERVAQSRQVNCDQNHGRGCDCVGDALRAFLATPTVREGGAALAGEVRCAQCPAFIHLDGDRWKDRQNFGYCAGREHTDSHKPEGGAARHEFVQKKRMIREAGCEVCHRSAADPVHLQSGELDRLLTEAHAESGGGAATEPCERCHGTGLVPEPGETHGDDADDACLPCPGEGGAATGGTPHAFVEAPGNALCHREQRHGNYDCLRPASDPIHAAPEPAGGPPAGGTHAFVGSDMLLTAFGGERLCTCGKPKSDPVHGEPETRGERWRQIREADLASLRTDPPTPARSTEEPTAERCKNCGHVRDSHRDGRYDCRECGGCVGCMFFTATTGEGEGK